MAEIRGTGLGVETEFTDNQKVRLDSVGLDVEYVPGQNYRCLSQAAVEAEYTVNPERDLSTAGILLEFEDLTNRRYTTQVVSLVEFVDADVLPAASGIPAPIIVATPVDTNICLHGGGHDWRNSEEFSWECVKGVGPSGACAMMSSQSLRTGGVSVMSCSVDGPCRFYFSIKRANDEDLYPYENFSLRCDEAPGPGGWDSYEYYGDGYLLVGQGIEWFEPSTSDDLSEWNEYSVNMPYGTHKLSFVYEVDADEAAYYSEYPEYPYTGGILVSNVFEKPIYNFPIHPSATESLVSATHSALTNAEESGYHPELWDNGTITNIAWTHNTDKSVDPEVLEVLRNFDDCWSAIRFDDYLESDYFVDDICNYVSEDILHVVLTAGNRQGMPTRMYYIQYSLGSLEEIVSEEIQPPHSLYELSTYINSGYIISASTSGLQMFYNSASWYSGYEVHFLSRDSSGSWASSYIGEFDISGFTLKGTGSILGGEYHLYSYLNFDSEVLLHIHGTPGSWSVETLSVNDIDTEYTRLWFDEEGCSVANVDFDSGILTLGCYARNSAPFSFPAIGYSSGTIGSMSPFIEVSAPGEEFTLLSQSGETEVYVPDYLMAFTKDLEGNLYFLISSYLYRNGELLSTYVASVLTLFTDGSTDFSVPLQVLVEYEADDGLAYFFYEGRSASFTTRTLLATGFIACIECVGMYAGVEFETPYGEDYYYWAVEHHFLFPNLVTLTGVWAQDRPLFRFEPVRKFYLSEVE